MAWSTKHGEPGGEALSAERDDPGSGLEEAEPDGGHAPFETPAGRDALLQELRELRSQLRQLEVDLAGYRSQEELLNKKLLLATTYAARVTEQARRDAQIALRKARARAGEVLGDIERERSRAERELLRLHRVTDETRAILSGFLTTALEQLRVGADDGAGRSTSAAETDQALRDVLESELRKEATPAPPPSPTVETLGP